MNGEGLKPSESDVDAPERIDFHPELGEFAEEYERVADDKAITTLIESQLPRLKDLD